MNTVSLLIYLTHVIPTLGAIFAVASTILGFTTLGSFIVLLIAKAEASNSHATENDKRRPTTILSILKPVAITGIISMILTVLLPNTQTMYMIAASELGEEIIVSDEAKVLYQDLRDILASYKSEEETE